MSKANVVIVGGTIAAGKSSLVESLSSSFGWNAVPELREGDKIQDIILRKLYEGGRIHLATIQFYFITNRYLQYKENSNSLVTSILDRGLWEDWIFAKLLMKSEPKAYEHYKKLWRTTIEKSIKNEGLPKAYIYLKVDWATFKERIYKRNRSAEINNFAKNEAYFKELLQEYNNTFVNLLKEWNIDIIEIDTTNMSKEEVNSFAISKLREMRIYE